MNKSKLIEQITGFSLMPSLGDSPHIKIHFRLFVRNEINIKQSEPRVHLSFC